MSLPESALAAFELQQCPEVVAAAEVTPVHVREVEFRVDGLPDHEIREPFGASLDDQIGFLGEHEAVLHVGDTETVTRSVP